MAELDILLFTVDIALARRAAAAGVAGFIVDWEDRTGAAERCTTDDGAGPDTVHDLQRLAAESRASLWCRINAVGEDTAREVDLAIACGASHIVVPMIETPQHVERVATLVDRRARLGIMVETVAACEGAREIARVPVDLVYVGLLDLAIDRREGNVFGPLADGTADRVRDCFGDDTRFGIGGVTVVDGGSPVPCAALMGELARLRTDFVFARRSFKRDMLGRDMVDECQRIRATWNSLRARPSVRVETDHEDFVRRFGESWPR